MRNAGNTPRTVEEVTWYENGEGKPRVKVRLADGTTCGLRDLTKLEANQAARKFYPGIAGNVWVRLTTETIDRAIRLNDEAEAKVLIAVQAAAKAKAEPTPKPEPRPEFREYEPTPEPEPKVDGYAHLATDTDPASKLAEAIQAIAAGAKQGVDVDQVRDIVQAEVRRQADSIGVVKVEVTTPEAVVTIEGAHQVFARVLRYAAARENIFLVGPAGTGKSTIAHQVSEALGLPFYALSYGPTTSPTKTFGFQNADGAYVRTPFRDAYENGGVFCGDELDNGHPGLVAELNQALANGYCAFADGMIARHPDFIFIATGNTYGTGPDRQFVGRNILDAATLDRFWTVEVGVDEALEKRLALAYGDTATIRDWIATVRTARKNAAAAKLPFIVSPRATIGGAKLLAQGAPLVEVLEDRLLKGCTTDVRQKLGV